MWKFLKKLFLLETSKNTDKPMKKLRDLDIMHSVWVLQDEILYEGWVMEISRRSIVVCYGDDLQDYKFRFDKSEDGLTINQDNKILYANRPV